MFLKKLRTSTIPLIGRSRQFQSGVLGIVLLTIATRLPALLHPQPIDDEAPYAVVANEIIDGGKPYIDVVDRKPPLLFWTYAAVFEMAGKYNWRALHTVALLWTLGTMAGLYVIGQRLFDRPTGLIAALLYSVFQPWAMEKNLAFNGELLMNLPIVWAYVIAFARSSSRARPELLAAGALLAGAFLLKQPAAIAAVPLGIYLLLPSYAAGRGFTRTVAIAHAALLTVGFFATLALVIVVLWKQGILSEAYYWTVTNHAVPHIFWTSGVLYSLAFIGACLPLLLGATIAGRAGDRMWAGKNTEHTAVIGLLAASVLGVVAGARFYPHYYIQLVPPLVLLAAPRYAMLWSGRTQPRHWLLRPIFTYTWLAFTAFAFLISHTITLARQRKPTEAGRYLLEHTAPEDRVFIWGPSAGKFYLQAQRRPACRYFVTFPLTGHVFGGPLPGVDTRKWIMPGTWSTLEQDFAKHPPKYIVDLKSNTDPRYQVQAFPILAKFLAERYQPVARTAEGIIYRASTRGGGVEGNE